MSEYTCNQKIWSDVWRWHRCGKPAKFWADFGGMTLVPLCGVHANVAKRAKRKVKPIEQSSTSTDALP